MSVFNPQQFLETQQSGGEKFDTTRIPVPEGEYLGLVEKVSAREIEQKDGAKRQIMTVLWEIDDPESKVKLVTGREKNLVPQDIFLDVTPEGGLDRSKGMNVDLGRFLEAIGLNGKKWSPAGFKGLQARVLVTHRANQDTNEMMHQIRKVMPVSGASVEKAAA